MNIFSISWNNLAAKPLSTLLSLLLLTLGVSIISLLLLLNVQIEDNSRKNVRDIDMVLGAKGSPMQLILSSIYHIDDPTGNIPKVEADRIAKHPLVESAVPLAYGDNYKGYRILGTNHDYVETYGVALGAGKLWEADYEVTLGAATAKRLELSVGDEFFGSHGLVSDADVHDSHAYQVVGILEPSGTVLDQMILTNIASVWGIHDGHGAEPMADSLREYTSMLVAFRSPMGMVQLPRMINQETSMMAALPAIEINKLTTKILPIAINTGQGIALAIIVISAISVFISLFNSLKDRKYELALMRTMGASRLQLFWIVVMEGIWLAAVGALLGLLISRLGLWVLNKTIIETYHYDFSHMGLLTDEWTLVVVTLGIGFLAAAIPGLQAFRLNISQTLADG
ncbi:FtsX-like permease family protein [Pontibacter sp. G13]|uniref:ABC transporter permease n=1 Tax=Pontibacter sp. G13 TaxID=3074898 RepID=UPI0028893942|nr:FtsX-like permease family protein [Pontibacter sp. G13]WNJ19223.1 FtsX-like permease family protein [Pontibacter sp. G13]